MIDPLFWSYWTLTGRVEPIGQIVKLEWTPAERRVQSGQGGHLPQPRQQKCGRLALLQQGQGAKEQMGQGAREQRSQGAKEPRSVLIRSQVPLTKGLIYLGGQKEQAGGPSSQGAEPRSL